MSYVYVPLAGGIIAIIMGITGWKKKIKGMFCGIRKINVDTDRYVKYMGIMTASVGLIFIFMGVVSFFVELPNVGISLFALCFIAVFTIACEMKLKIRTE